MNCPICDAEARITKRRSPVHVPMAEDVYMEEEICECPSCGSSTRVGGEMQEVVDIVGDKDRLTWGFHKYTENATEDMIRRESDGKEFVVDTKGELQELIRDTFGV